jgi:hypothetical protein
MASILLSEADPDVRRLLVVLLERLGHEAIVLEGGVSTPPSADLMLLEPSEPTRLEQARAIREQRPSLPVVCVSVLPARTAGETWRNLEVPDADPSPLRATAPMRARTPGLSVDADAGRG